MVLKLSGLEDKRTITRTVTDQWPAQTTPMLLVLLGTVYAHITFIFLLWTAAKCWTMTISLLRHIEITCQSLPSRFTETRWKTKWNQNTNLNGKCLAEYSTVGTTSPDSLWAVMRDLLYQIYWNSQHLLLTYLSDFFKFSAIVLVLLFIAKSSYSMDSCSFT